MIKFDYDSACSIEFFLFLMPRHNKIQITVYLRILQKLFQSESYGLSILIGWKLRRSQLGMLKMSRI